MGSRLLRSQLLSATSEWTPENGEVLRKDWAKGTAAFFNSWSQAGCLITVSGESQFVIHRRMLLSGQTLIKVHAINTHTFNYAEGWIICASQTHKNTCLSETLVWTQTLTIHSHCISSAPQHMHMGPEAYTYAVFIIIPLYYSWPASWVLHYFPFHFEHVCMRYIISSYSLLLACKKAQLPKIQ